jgi:RimJ/RimL family protein N-acetyltransferase
MRRVLLPGEPLVEAETALRPWRDDDLDDLVALCQDPEIGRWTRVPFPYRTTDGRAYLLHRYDLLAAGVSAPFAIVAAAGGALLGSISLMRIDHEQARAEIGYWLGAEARGRGHATRAVQAISRWGFKALSLERLSLHIASGNAPSQAVAQRAGFSREALMRSYAARLNERQDMIVFGLLKR